MIAMVVQLLLVSVPLLAQKPDRTRPNILLILTDDLGWNDLSIYGTKDVRTPHIDALCRSGMRFDRFYSNSPVCAPTRASLMTGRYPDRVGVPGLIRSLPDNNWGFLDPSAVLLPSRLKSAGYHTAHVGKWNLGFDLPNLPNDKGFDHFHGWLEDMMDDYWLHRRHGRNYMRSDTQVIDPVGHATDLFTQWSVDHIHARAKDASPFFLYLAYNAPHFPVQPPKEWLDRVLKREPGIGRTRASLVALIEHMDDGIGKVMKALKESGQYDNTLVIFTGDNGGNLSDSAWNGPLRDGKQSMYEGGIRVPTCLSWPGVIAPGTISHQLNLSMDIFPTLMDLAGLPRGEQTDGRSFLPTLLGKPEAPEERPLYFIRREGGERYGGKAYHAIRLGDWKLLQNSPFQPMELYNLREDPMERNDRINTNPAIYRKLNALLMQHIQEGGRIPWQRPGR
jgi:arylsulfatase A-like enzyme